MLVLSRKQGERLIIGNDITITVTKCGNNRVVIGIDAPKEVAIRRGELEDLSSVNTSLPAVTADQESISLHRALSLV